MYSAQESFGLLGKFCSIYVFLHKGNYILANAQEPFLACQAGLFKGHPAQ